MKKQSFGKILSFLPALAMLAAIFSFSAQTGTQSGGLSQTASQWLVAHWRALTGGDCSPDAIALQAKAIEFWVRNRIRPAVSEHIASFWGLSDPPQITHPADTAHLRRCGGRR